MFKDTSLQTKLFTAFILVGVIVLVVALIGWTGNTKISQKFSSLSENYFPSVSSLWKANEAHSRIQASDKALIITSLSSEQRQLEVSKLQNALKDLNDGIQSYDQLPREPDEDKIYQPLKVKLSDWEKNQAEFMQLHEQLQQLNVSNTRQAQADLVNQGKVNTAESLRAQAALAALTKMNEYAFAKLDPASDAFKVSLIELLNYNAKNVDKSTLEGRDTLKASTFLLLLGLVVGPLTALVLGWYFSSTITQALGAQIVQVVGVAEKISKGDLTGIVEVTNTKDEVGKLQAAIGIMSENLSSLIRQVQKSGIQITTSATQMAASGKQLEATITEQVASVNQVANTARKISSTSGQLVKTMDEVEQTAQATAQAAGDSQKDLNQMEKTMRNLANSTTTISSKLGAISEKANNINSIVTTITKVADQTNLLSLNAAIEAEKAGEYGTGFAVVAREIRRLADQTAVATLDIESMVKEMQGAVSTGVMEMDKFTKEVERGVEDVRHIGGKIESIIGQVQILTPRFQQVSNSMESQSQGAGQISESMLQLSEASSQTADSLREINNAIGQLNEAAQGLRQEISRFKVIHN